MNEHPHINRRIAVGAGWMVSMRMADRLIGLVSIGILARLLLPQDFGLVGYAMAFFAILEIFFQFSFETVLIRDQESSRESYDTAWTLNLIKGLVLGLLMFIGAKPIAVFFNEPAVETILHWFALVPTIRGLENIGIVDFQKHMEFNKEFYLNFSVRVLSTFATLGLAIYFRSYWALVAGNLLRAVLRVILSYVMSAYRPRLALSRFSRVFGFSKWLLIQNLFSGVNRRFPVFAIGRFCAAQDVGFFNIAVELSDFASQELAAPIRRALFPGVAKVANDPIQMVQTILACLSVIVLIGLPMTLGIAVAAPLIVPVLLGSNWMEVVPIIQALSVNAMTYILYSNSHIVFLAINKPEITAYVSATRSAMLVPAVLMLVPEYGALGAAVALAGVNIFLMTLEYFLVLRMIDLTLGDVAAVIWRSVLGVVVMGVCVRLTYTEVMLGSDLAMVLQLLVCVAVGAASYVLVVSALWWLSGRPNHAEAYVFGMLKKCGGLCQQIWRQRWIYLSGRGDL